MMVSMLSLLNILIQIILDYIRYSETKKIPCSFLETIEENEEIFFEKFKSLELYNLNELNSLIEPLKKIYINQDKLFQLIIKKLEKLFTEKYIHIKNYEWEHFLKLIPQNNVSLIINLLERLIRDLTYISELDREIRYKKYLIEEKKEKELKELKKVCENHK